MVTAQSSSDPRGLFQGSTDIGTAQAGSSVYDNASHSYTIKGGGADIWGTADDFRLSWVRLSGDATLSADVHIAQPSTHRLAKAVLMFRQSLAPDSPYVDVAMHADGHITLQYRETAGGPTRDNVLAQHDALRLRVERKGDRYSVYALTPSGELGSPESIVIAMKDPVYVGIGVCSHNAEALQTITFSHVTLATPNGLGQPSR